MWGHQENLIILVEPSVRDHNPPSLSAWKRKLQDIVYWGNHRLCEITYQESSTIIAWQLHY